VRRLTAASVAFAVVALGIVWAVTAFIMRDLSKTYVSRVITQAKGEAEAFARMANDQALIGEGDARETITGVPGGAIDPDALMPELPQIDHAAGLNVEPLPRRLRATDEHALRASGSRPRGSRVPGILMTSGQEVEYHADGQLIGRDAFQHIQIRYPGGKQVIAFQKSDRRTDPQVLARIGSSTIEKTVIEHRPSSRPVVIAWDSTLNGQPVQLQAAIEADVVDEGIAELRGQIVPKIAAAGGVFILLLVLAYVYVLRLMREARCLEAEANEQALLAQVGMLAAGLAHEIRNPLSAVQMNLQLLEEDLEEAQAPALVAVASAGASSGALRLEAPGPAGTPPPSGEAVGLLRTTQREIRRLSTLVTDFLAYARPAEPHLAPHLLDAIASDCVEVFRAFAAEQGVRLETDLRCGQVAVAVDEAMVKQALTNVILNALQAVAQPGGVVQVATRRTHAAQVVDVRDNGPGLPDDVEQLFRIFHSTKKGGSGLGLAISRGVAERHGGTLVARGQPEGGAVFTLTLPARQGGR
jgi:signal transduction histidine kinase